MIIKLLSLLVFGVIVVYGNLLILLTINDDSYPRFETKYGSVIYSFEENQCSKHSCVLKKYAYIKLDGKNNVEKITVDALYKKDERVEVTKVVYADLLFYEGLLVVFTIIFDVMLMAMLGIWAVYGILE